MRYRTEKTIVDEKGHKFKIGDTVTVIYNKESGSYQNRFRNPVERQEMTDSVTEKGCY